MCRVRALRVSATRAFFCVVRRFSFTLSCLHLRRCHRFDGPPLKRSGVGPFLLVCRPIGTSADTFGKLPEGWARPCSRRSRRPRASERASWAIMRIHRPSRGLLFSRARRSRMYPRPPRAARPDNSSFAFRRVVLPSCTCCLVCFVFLFLFAGGRWTPYPPTLSSTRGLARRAKRPGRRRPTPFSSSPFTAGQSVSG